MAPEWGFQPMSSESKGQCYTADVDQPRLSFQLALIIPPQKCFHFTSKPLPGLISFPFQSEPHYLLHKIFLTTFFFFFFYM